MDDLTEIRKRRLALGIPLGTLAAAVGRSDATMSRIERGKIRPTYELAQQIFRYLAQQEGIAAPLLRALDLMNTQLVSIEGTATVGEAALAMEKGGFSQVPVVEGGRVTGSLSESAVLRALAQPNGRRTRVQEVQEGAYPLVESDFPADLLGALLSHYSAVLVTQRGELRGIITKTDLIRGLRGNLLRRSPAAVEVRSPPGARHVSPRS
jgi:predicted transcriptional regulator